MPLLRTATSLVDVFSPNNVLGQAITTEVLTSTLAGTNSADFAFGVLAPQGLVPNGTGIITDANSSQAIVMSRWPSDSSARHIYVAGTKTLTANTPTTVRITTGSGISGSSLSSADIVSANPTITVNLGAQGTVNFTDTSLYATHAAGKELVDCVYKATASGTAGLTVWMNIRYWRSGRMWVEVIVDNGWIDRTDADVTYTPQVTIGSTVVYNPGSISHLRKTGWFAEGWIGTDPKLNCAPNAPDLIASGMLPNYYMDTPSSAALTTLYTSYIYGGLGDWDTFFPGTGDSSQIGWLPNWDALYITSNGNLSAFNAVINMTRALRGFQIVWRDHNDNDGAVRPSQRPNATFQGTAGSGGGMPSDYATSSNTKIWELAHHGSSGYVAYITSCRWSMLDTMRLQSANCYLAQQSSHGSPGTGRRLFEQVRANSWSIRTWSQYVAIAPTGDAVATDYAALISTNINAWATVAADPNLNVMGVLFDFDIFASSDGVGSLKNFMHVFAVNTFGMGSKLKPLSNMTNWNICRDSYYKYIVGLWGDGSSGYYYTYCDDYVIQAASAQPPNQDMTSTTGNWYSTWAAVWNNTNTTLGRTPTINNTLQSGNSSVIYYIASMQLGMSCAVDDNATGALAMYNKMLGTTNWLTQYRRSTDSGDSAGTSGGFADTPKYGVQPIGFHVV